MNKIELEIINITQGFTQHHSYAVVLGEVKGKRRLPIVIGANYSHFAEAIALVNMKGCVSISNQNELNEAFDNLIFNEDIRHEKGHICETFVQMNKGATDVILKYLN